MYIVYVLYSDDFTRFYVGMTNNLERRLYEHNSRQNRSTKAYVPWRVIHKELFETRNEARIREKYLKSGIGREFTKTLI